MVTGETGEAHATTTATTTTTTATGLTTSEAARRLAAHGPNEIRRARGPSPLRIFLGQWKGIFTWLLVAAAVVSGALGEVADAVAIGVILLLNVLIGFFQELKSEKAVEALRALTSPHARVLRDGHVVDVRASEVVPGDVLVLEAGDVVAADGRLLEAHSLAVNEAMLTGESLPTDKRAEPPGRVSAREATTPKTTRALAEQSGSVFMGTAVSAGTGRAVVEKTGMATELGKIADLLETATEDETPLQQRLARVGRTLLILCLAIVVVVGGLGLWRDHPPMEVVLSAVSLAVAAVPEGLTAIVTIALALGVQRMASRHVLIRKLPAVETLGTATVICTDKTGTLTTGVMALREVWGLHPDFVVAAAAACSDADLAANTGDPTELAIVREAYARGVIDADLEQKNPRVHTNPFDADRKRMSILRSDGRLYVKGAVDLLLPLCTKTDAGTQADALAANAEMAGRGLRVLAVALGASRDEQDLELIGLVAIADPPRTEAIEAVARARRAGIKTVMITGDHPATALAIARELGIVQPHDDPARLVHARATPEDKLTIVRDWKTQGEVVAMTGDGVNDAPALREAHIGIAMGRTGTEVTREASDMILTDDNFASIVEAVREGRGIFDNIQKALVYLLSGNASELFLMLGASLIGLPLPLTPIMILWVNLVTDGLPALALVTDPTREDALDHPPRRSDEAILGRRQWTQIFAVGVLEAGLVTGVFAWALETRGLAPARDLAFTTLVFAEILRSAAARSPDRLLWEVGAFTNMRLVAVVLLSIGAQLALQRIGWTASLFDIGTLGFDDLVIAAAIGLVPVSILEIRKLLRRLLWR